MSEINKQERASLKFQCPKCGKIPQDQVMFLCNTCKQEDLVEKEGVFICPSCLTPGENFECCQCGSTEVKLLPGFPEKNA